MALPRPAERTRLERQAPFLDIGQRGQDDRPDQRQDPAQPRPDAALRVEAARPLALADDRGTLDEGRDRLDRRHGDEGRPRGTPRRSRSRTNARGSVVRMNNPIEVEMANSRRTVWAAKSTPSTVASNGPISKITVVPARVKTLTRMTDTAIGRVSRNEARASRRSTPARHASTSMIATMTIGPT